MTNRMTCLVAAAALGLLATPAVAEPVALTESELEDVNGGGGLDLKGIRLQLTKLNHQLNRATVIQTAIAVSNSYAIAISLGGAPAIANAVSTANAINYSIIQQVNLSY